jgi:hypothetical protein
MSAKTGEDRQFSKLIESGIMRLGPPETPAAPNAFRHVLVWDRIGRKGQKCRILKQSGSLAQIEFEDGFVTRINRFAVRRE